MRLVDLVPDACSGTRRAQDQDTRWHKPGTRLTCADTRGHIGHKIINSSGTRAHRPLGLCPCPRSPRGHMQRGVAVRSNPQHERTPAVRQTPGGLADPTLERIDMLDVTPCPAAIRKPWPRDPSISVGSDGSITGAPVNYSHRYPRISHGGRWAYVHVIVCETFHGPQPQEGMFALHENDVATDNRADNIRWGTRKDNTADARRNGLTPEGEKHWFARVTEDDVRAIRARHAGGERGADIARSYGLSRQVIHAITSRKNWAHIA